MDREYKYIVGSKYFFGNYPDYQSKDTDMLIIEGRPNPQFPYKHMMIIRGQGKDMFFYRKKTADEFVDYTLELNVPMSIGKFLIKEFCEDFGITIDHLKRLKDLVDRMDEKHLYVQYIYNVIVENERWDLTDEERDEAYKLYQEAKNQQ